MSCVCCEGLIELTVKKDFFLRSVFQSGYHLPEPVSSGDVLLSTGTEMRYRGRPKSRYIHIVLSESHNA